MPVDDVNTTVYIDCTKFGVMNQPEINAIGELVERMLFRNPYRKGTKFFVHSKFFCAPSFSL